MSKLDELRKSARPEREGFDRRDRHAAAAPAPASGPPPVAWGGALPRRRRDPARHDRRRPLAAAHEFDEEELAAWPSRSGPAASSNPAGSSGSKSRGCTWS